MAILVCGGAGYIGSHMVAELIENNKEVVILDNFEKGHEDAILGGKLYKGDLRDRKILDKIFTENNIEAVIDFAAYSLVGESMTEPLKYFNNNVSGTISLLEAMSYGHCCLVSDIEQNLEVIQSYGYSFESKNSDDLYEKLKELLDNENKILDVRSKVKEYVNNKYNWDKVSEDTEKAYKALKSK